jgi:two-component system, cell cycle sensor histidine kinase and response regulator CckA
MTSKSRKFAGKKRTLHVKDMGATLRRGTTFHDSPRAATERGPIDQQDRTSEKLFRKVFEEGPLGMSMTERRTGRFISANSPFCRMLGYSREELLRMTFLDITHPEHRKQDAERVKSLWAGEIPVYKTEKRYLRKNGDMFWGALTVTTVCSADGNPAYSLAMIEDISERKRAETALRSLSARQEALLSAVPEIIMEVDKNKIYTWANKYGRDFFGDDVIGKEAAAYFEGEQETYDTVRPLFRGTENCVYVESWQRRRDGQKRLLAWWCTPLKDKDGNVTGALSSARDITERRKDEESLKESENKFRELFNNAQVGMYRSSLDGSAILAANPKVCELFGCSEAELLGNTAVIRWADAGARKKMIADLRTTGFLRDYEINILTKKGDVRTCLVSVILHQEKGYIEGSLTDITDRKRAEETLHQLVRDLLFVSHSAMELVELPREKDIYTLIGEQLEQITPPSAILAVSEFDETAGVFQLRWITGLEKTMRMIRNIIGKDPLEIRGDFGPEARQALSTGKLHKIHAGLQDFAHIIPEKIMQPAAKLVGVTAFYVIGFVKEKKTLGGLCIFLRGESSISNPSVLETLAAQAAMAIAKRKAEQALGENEMRYRMVFDHAKDGIALADAETGILTDCNQALCDLVGSDKSEIIGKPQSVLHPPQKLASGLTANFVEARANIEERIHEDRLLTKSGNEIPVEIRVGPAEIDGRRYLLGVFRDITERKRTEEALQTSKEQLSEALEMAHLGHWEYDVPNDRFTFNDNFYRIFRTSAVQVGGYSMPSAEYARRFVHPDDGPMVGEEVRKAIEATDPHFSRQLEHRIMYADGTVGYISVRFFIVKNAQGRTVRTYGVNQDITERKRAEEALRKSEEKYRSLVDGANEGILVTQDGMLKFVNHRAAEFSGYPEPELMTKPFPGFIYPDDRVMVLDYYMKRMKGDPAPASYEFRLLTAGGSAKWVAINTVVIDWNGRPAALSFLTDIAERKYLEKEKEKLLSQLLQAQKMEAIGTLAGGVAHDFNNLLSAISGYASLAMAKVAESDPLHRDLTQVSNAATKAAGVVRQLLLFSRKHPMQLVPVNLNNTVKALVKMLDRVIGENIAIKLDVGNELWPIQADEGSIEQVIMNLAVNARDAMPDGGELLIKTENTTVDPEYCHRISAGRPGRFVCLSIADTGTGMDELVQEHIFEPFFTTKAAGKGTGLGLSVVLGIVQQHEGWIEVHSESGKGSTFMVYLPCSSVKAEQKNREPVPVSALRGNGERIMVVEDHEEVRFLAKEILTANGYSVFTASCAKEALALFEKENGKFDLVFTDVGLPDKSGVWLVDELLKRGKIAVLFCSGYTDEKSNWDYIKNKNMRFLRKPYSIPDLLAAVKEVLGQEKS